MPKPVALPTIWSPGALYTTGPFIGQPNKSPPAGAIAVDGNRPGSLDPTPAEAMNFWQNETSEWSTWVYEGSSSPLGTAHIIETDANGRGHIVGLDLTDAVDRRLCLWNSGAATFPAVTLSTLGGDGFTAVVGGSGSNFVANLSNNNSVGFRATDLAGGAGRMFEANLAGMGGVGTITCASTTPGLTIQTVDTTALTVQATGTGAGLRVVPSLGASPPSDGLIEISSLDGRMSFRDPGVTRRIVWATEFGFDVTQVSNVALINAGVASFSFPYFFQSGKRYEITYGCGIGRTAGATRQIIDLVNIGGLAFSNTFGQELTLFQGGAAQIERSHSQTVVWTSFLPSGSYNVQFLMFQSVGAGSCHYNNSFVIIRGVLD